MKHQRENWILKLDRVNNQKNDGMYVCGIQEDGGLK